MNSLINFEVKNTPLKMQNLRLIGRALRALDVPFLESVSEEVDISNWYVWATFFLKSQFLASAFRRIDTPTTYLSNIRTSIYVFPAKFHNLLTLFWHKQ